MSEKGKDWKDLIGIGIEENFSFQRTAKEILNSWAGGLPEKTRQKLLEVAKKHFPEYEIVDVNYFKPPINEKHLLIKFNLPDNITVKEYYEFLDNLPKKTPFYPVSTVSFDFLKDTDPIPDEMKDAIKTIYVWTNDENFLKEWRKILEETDV